MKITKIAMEPSPTVIFVQTQPSQLDAPFYSLLSRLTARRILVALLNGGQPTRSDIDPELGFVPQFPKPLQDYPILCLPRGSIGVRRLIRVVLDYRPRMVIVQDQTWCEKALIALVCRRAGIAVAMRSDKNHISHGARVGPSLNLERWVVSGLFDALAPVSRLTSEYYGWKSPESTWWFPYSSLASKFVRPPSAGLATERIHGRLGIPQGKTVFLAVAKFVERENPMAVLRAFAEVRAKCADAALIFVGAGPLEDQLKSFVSSTSVDDVHFVGYVPFAQLQDYFFASDVFVHLARSEPWGTSPQDALLACMALVTSSQVGSGVCHLTSDLARYVVGVDDDQAAAAVMLELVGMPSQRAHFAPAWREVHSIYTVESLAGWWANKIKLGAH